VYVRVTGVVIEDDLIGIMRACKSREPR